MSPQMESGQQYERTSTGYQGYQGYEGKDSRPPYGSADGQGPSVGFDDNLVAVIAERLLSRLNQQDSSGKVFGSRFSSNRPSPGQRLALAIVSVAILVPIISILFPVGGLSFGSLVALVIICGAIACINGIFNLFR